jgi:hypothetical protein
MLHINELQIVSISYRDLQQFSACDGGESTSYPLRQMAAILATMTSARYVASGTGLAVLQEGGLVSNDRSGSY